MKNMPSDKVTVDLTETEAASFLKWRENQANFEILAASGVFDIRNGSAEVHFNAEGQIASIEAHVKMFRRARIAAVVHLSPLKAVDKEDPVV